jgi:hypothetical protein
MSFCQLGMRRFRAEFKKKRTRAGAKFPQLGIFSLISARQHPPTSEPRCGRLHSNQSNPHSSQSGSIRNRAALAGPGRFQQDQSGSIQARAAPSRLYPSQNSPFSDQSRLIRARAALSGPELVHQGQSSSRRSKTAPPGQQRLHPSQKRLHPGQNVHI